MSRRLLVGLGLAAAGITMTAAALELFAHDFQPYGPSEKVAQVTIGAIWVVTGLIAWQRRPENRVGALMTALGFAELAHHLYWDAALPFTLVELVYWMSLPIAIHLFLAFPSGRLSTRFERLFVAFTYAAVALLSLANQLFWIPDDGACPDCPANLLLVGSYPGIEDALGAFGSLVIIAVLLTGVVLLVRRVRRASRPTRRALAPVLLTAALAAALLCAILVVDAAGVETEGSIVLWAGDVAFAAIPLAFLLGLLRTRLHHSAVADLVVELGSLRRPGEVRDALSRALGDPSLELAFWLPDTERYVDPEGRDLPLADLPEPGRAVTVLEHKGKRLAALVHDPVLLDDPELVRAVGAAATLALENSRLQAELRAQLTEVRASRARIVEAGDAERRRLERDLHDGAQQRLLGVRLALRLARAKLADGTAADELLADADAELVDAVAELRALARGIHPAILTEEGLAPALAGLARRASVPVELTVRAERLPSAVEATAYFVASEALANVTKHAHASRVSIGVERRNGQLAVEVTDDGVGGADGDGAGLRGLRDRVEALDGRLRIDSPVGRGTSVSAAIPCG